MSDSLGQQIYIENRTGAAGTIATAAVARAEPDGYSLLLAQTANAANETLYRICSTNSVSTSWRLRR